MSLLDQIKILYEDEDVVVINKPSGLIVHSDGKTSEPSVTDWVIEKYPEAENVGEPLIMNREVRVKNKESTPNSKFLTNNFTILRPGIVHRIDRETSGVLVLAKNQEAFEFLKKQFQNREVEKIYHAFVWGDIKKDEGTVNRSIGKSKKDFRQWSAQRGARGEMREAITEYRVLKRSREITFLEIRPKTGRTHQIRVHMKAVNHPLLCDSLYSPKHPPELGLKRLALHAYGLKFRNFKGEIIEIKAPYSEDFERALEQFESLPK
jgi:23S rRNA pseudouridine1911/1915/1917 synthase